MTRIFGHIPGYPPGTLFTGRRELHDARVHTGLRAGISGSGFEGAESIVVSGGYEDDEDYGDLIIYTGHGGRNPNTGVQVADQELMMWNLALARSADLGLPVRVVRGARGNPAYSPPSGFRYDGLFSVDSYWQQVGRSGFRVWRYRLVQLGDPIDLPQTGEAGPAPRAEATVQRIIRNTAAAQRVKELHGSRCQVCGEVVMTPSGVYAEAAHIRPLGTPHDGPDTPENILCLCPNDHVRFDRGAIQLNDQLEWFDALTLQSIGPLRRAPGHWISRDQVRYHSMLWLTVVNSGEPMH